MVISFSEKVACYPHKKSSISQVCGDDIGHLQKISTKLSVETQGTEIGKPAGLLSGLRLLSFNETMLKVDLTAPQGGLFELVASDLDLDPAIFSKIQVNLEFKPSEDTLRVIIGVQSDALLECDRTLQEFVMPISNTHELLLLTRGQEPDADGTTEHIELEPRQRVLDLTSIARDALMLAIPVRKVAPEAEELQIQTSFGAPAEEADHRWSALLAMREEHAHKY